MVEIIVGTRASRLAVKQTSDVVKRLCALYPQKKFMIKKMSGGREGERKALLSKEGKERFVRGLKKALLKKEIDIAVHSLKDVPVDSPPEFELACFPERKQAEDVLITPDGVKLDDLPAGAVLGTSSRRRRAQVARLRSEVEFAPLRGNIETRIEKMNERGLDGIILAAAGLIRLGKKTLIAEFLPTEICVPAGGQGTLVVEILRERKDLLEMLAPIDTKQVRWVSLAERKFLQMLGVDCHLPVGVLGRIKKSETGDQVLCLRSFLGGDTCEPVTGVFEGQLGNEREPLKKLEKKACSLGARLAEDVLARGGQKLLKKIRS